MKAIIYDKNKTYMFPSGKLATPEVMKSEYSACAVFDFVVYTDSSETTIFQLETLAQACDRYQVDAGISASEKIAIINQKMNEPKPVVEHEPTPEEMSAASLASIAASMQYQNMLTLEDVPGV